MIQKTQLTMLTCLAAAQVLHETLDDLEHTQFYRHSLKSAAKKFELEISKTCDKYIDDLFKVDEETMQQIQEGITEICKEMASMDPGRIAYIGQLLKDGSLVYKSKKV